MDELQPIIDVLKRVIASGFITNAKPLSLMLIAPVGAGKTTSLVKFSLHKQILGLSDATPYGICKLLPEIKANDVKHIIIYDMVEPMSRNKTTVNSLIGFLNSLIEEGIFKISTGFIDVKEPLSLGLISSTTPKELFDRRRGWLGMGFISRMLPLSFKYSQTAVIQILEKIAHQGLEDIKYEKLKIIEKSIDGNSTVNMNLIPYAQNIDRGSDKPLPFRRQKQLMILCMANALLRGDTKVLKEDFEWFKSVSKWINFDFNPL